MLRRARLCHSKSSVRPSVCPSVRDVEVCFSHRLEYFENNFTAEELKASAWADPNMGHLVQRKHPQNWGGIWVGSLGSAKTCNISETVQDRTKVIITD